jgi:hypothetical protein
MDVLFHLEQKLSFKVPIPPHATKDHLEQPSKIYCNKQLLFFVGISFV